MAKVVKLTGEVGILALIVLFNLSSSDNSIFSSNVDSKLRSKCNIDLTRSSLGKINFFNGPDINPASTFFSFSFWVSNDAKQRKDRLVVLFLIEYVDDNGDIVPRLYLPKTLGILA